MTSNVMGREIKKVRLIDDDQGVREMYGYKVEDLKMNPEEVIGPILDVASLCAGFDEKHDAVICDYNLKVRNYSKMDGDEIVEGLYKRNLPAILCTRLVQMDGALRRRKRYIPIIIKPDDLTADSIRSAFSLCINEYAGKFIPHRRPWKTLIRIEGGKLINEGKLIEVNAVIPSWDSSTLLQFEWVVGENEALKNVRKSIENGEISRIYATVNAGAEAADDIFVEEWSLK